MLKCSQGWGMLRLFWVSFFNVLPKGYPICYIPTPFFLAFDINLQLLIQPLWGFLGNS
jgi:hypothetical protein